MYKTVNKRFACDIVVIQPGEFYVTTDPNEAIATVLGSCIAVCLFDPVSKVRGMNHFMLPGDFRNEEIFSSKSGRYGMFAMESLINEMMKHGAKRASFVAKMFGGGHIMTFRKGDGNIPEANIAFAETYLAFEEIKVIASDVGGNWGRKVIMLNDSTGKVLVKKLAAKTTGDFIEEENRYKATIFKQRRDEVSGGVTLFQK